MIDILEFEFSSAINGEKLYEFYGLKKTNNPKLKHLPLMLHNKFTINKNVLFLYLW